MAVRSRTSRRRATRARRSSAVDLLLGVLLITALVGGAMVLIDPLEGYLAERQRVAVLEQQAVALEDENLRLARRIDDLDDPVTIELLARAQQGLVREGEVPYVLTAPEVDAPRILEAPVVPVVEPDLLDRIVAWIRALAG
jgi:cell division protein FtsB